MTVETIPEHITAAYLQTLPQTLIVSWASDCAEHVLGMFEGKHPTDNRPRLAIAAARGWVAGTVTGVEAQEVADAAYAGAAAAYAAPTAADAAYAAYAAAAAAYAAAAVVPAYASADAVYAAYAAYAAATDAAAYAHAAAVYAAYSAAIAASAASERVWQRNRLRELLANDE